MYTEAQINNVLKSTGTSYRQCGKRDAKNPAVRLYDIEVVDARTHETVHLVKDHPTVEAGLIEAAKWLIDNKDGKTTSTAPSMTEARVGELEKALAETNARLAAITAASQPAPATSTEGSEPTIRRRRKNEPPPERVADETT